MPNIYQFSQNWEEDGGGRSVARALRQGAYNGAADEVGGNGGQGLQGGQLLPYPRREAGFLENKNALINWFVALPACRFKCHKNFEQVRINGLRRAGSQNLKNN